MSEDYKASFGVDAFGGTMSITVPDHAGKVVVAQDVFGERVDRMQIIVYPTGVEDEDAQVHVRFNRNGSIAEVLVPDAIPVRRFDDTVVHPWMLERDGQ